MNETDIQAIMIDNKTINQRIENSLNVFLQILTLLRRRAECLCILQIPLKKIYSPLTCINIFASQSLRFPHLLKS